MELCEIFVTALAIMDEKSGSPADCGYKMLWTRDWERLRELLLEGLNLVDETEEIIGLKEDSRGLDDGTYARGHRGFDTSEPRTNATRSATS